MYRRQLVAVWIGLAVGFVVTSPAWSQVPPVPTPPQNPITDEKAVLGKLLFWEEQLSSDNSIACGTCHKPAAGGADERAGLHPGLDLVFGNDDDVQGSEGVRRADEDGVYYSDPVFGTDAQVTGRTSQTFLGSLWSPTQFWDGRAEGPFTDPISGSVVIPVGGSLEIQALGPILNDVEMAFENRDWDDVVSKLETATPMLLASDIPVDMLDAIAVDPTYPELFEAAFNDDEITPTRIAMAIATYERTLVADETPYDDFLNGNPQALTPPQQRGAMFMENGPCSICHSGPLFTDNTFRNIGLRPIAEDSGREGVTGNPQDRGRFKVPSLRNVGLRDRLMHTGQITDVVDALEFYAQINGHIHFPENQDPAVLGGIPIPPPVLMEAADFLINGLTDPRVANETFPFDRPTLGSEVPASVDPDPVEPAVLAAEAFPNPFRDDVTIRFELVEAEDVEVSFYTASGQLVARQRHEGQVGSNVLSWDGRSAHGDRVSAGVYFVRLQSSIGVSTGRLVRIER